MGIGPLTGILNRVEVQYLDTFNQCFDFFLAESLPNFDSNYAHGLDGLIVKDSHLPNHINGQLTAPGGKNLRRSLLREDPEPEPVGHPLNEEMVGFYAPY